MSCEKITNELIDFLEGNLSKKTSKTIEEHLKTCISCQKELEQTKVFLGILNKEEIQFPSNNLRLNFEKLVADEKENSVSKVVQLKSKKTDWKPYLQIAASFLLIITAFYVGKYQSDVQLFTANKQQETQQQNVLALIENSSASKRIMAVHQAENIIQKDTKIIQALINRLFFDKNTNVRSAAAEALSKFTDEEMVKMALIKALETETASSIQIELIRILTEIQEKRAVKPMQELLKNEETPQFVKQQVKQNLSNLL